MSKASKYVGKFLKTYGKVIWNTSKQPLRGIKQVVKNSPKAFDDIAAIIANPDLDVIADNVVDIINDLDVIGIQARLTKQDVKYAKSQWKQFSKEIKDINKTASSSTPGNSSNALPSAGQSAEKGENDMKKPSTTHKPSTGGLKGSKSSRTRSTRYANTVPSTNHPEWYLRNAPASNLIGINIASRQNTVNDYITKFKVSGEEVSTNGSGSYSVPSTAGISVEMTIPKSATKDWHQAINFLFQNLRSTNAGATNYTAGKLSQYVHHVRCMDAGLSILGRAISIAFKGTFYDAMSPQVYFAASGLDYDSFVANMANARDLYYRLSALRTRIAPLNISLFDRTRWLFSNIFKDSNDTKSQNYLFFTDRVYYTDRAGEIQVSRLCRPGIDADQTGATFDDFAAELLEIFDSFQNNDKYQTIAGDILKAYEESAVVRYPAEIPHITPIYDEHILTQIQNASLSLKGNVDPRFEIDSDGFIVCNPIEAIQKDQANVYNNLIPASNVEILNKELVDPLYNANQDVVDKGRLLSSTRLMVSRHAVNGTDQDTGGQVIYDTFGSEIPEYIFVVLNANLDDTAYGLDYYEMTYLANAGYVMHTGEIVATYPDIPVWSWFNYFPLVRPVVVVEKYDQNELPGQWAINCPIFDFNNFGIAYKQNLDTYNAIATLSMLYTPYLYRAVNTKVLPNV